MILVQCAPSFDGIRLRAQAPSIDDASRRVALALKADNYDVTGEPSTLVYGTEWREMKDVEKSEAEIGLDGESRIDVRFSPRGSLYDIFFLITIRSDGNEYRPGATHNIVIKWQQVLREIVQEEFREEG
ncbi:MAG: hypothetical protein OEV30_08360 [Ignavibacteria bacterium]|nr:hypothetical protein [Ignavibacteria bacterium]